MTLSGAPAGKRVTFIAFMNLALDYEPNRSRGIAMHNLLFAVRRDLADHIAGTQVDPWNDDRRIEACLDWLERNWDYDIK